jgi:copper(I)-binding protein
MNTRWLAVLLLALASGLVAASEVRVDSAWVRASVPGQKTTVAYLNLTSRHAMRLVGGHSPLVKRVEIHEMRMQDNIMHMRALSEGLELPAGKTVKLEPGGIHLMLIGLRRQIKAGDTVPLTLALAGEGGSYQTLQLKLPVRAIGSE